MEENITFITVEEFKAQIGTTSMQVLKSPKTDKLFLATAEGDCYKVQQDIDGSKPMKMLIKDGDLSEACLVNINGGAKEVFSL